MKYACSRGKDHDRKDQHEHHRGAEVGFDHDEHCQPASHDATRNERAPEVSFFTRALLEEVSEKNYERELRHLTRLNRDAGKFYPAVRSINAAKTKHRKQTERADNQQRVHNPAALQLLIVELHRKQHHDEADRDKNTLLEHVVKL